MNRAASIKTIVGVIIALAIVVFAVISFVSTNNNAENDTDGSTSKNTNNNSEEMTPEEIKNEMTQAIVFNDFNTLFRFSARIPNSWQATYIPSLEAINIYNPTAIGSSDLEQSQIFIRYFRANDFLTLQTVNILEREETIIHGHDAVRYVIEKKQGVPDFANQPSWRSGRHEVVDIRLDQNNPTFFYVFAKNPDLDDEVFDAFIDELVFYNDEQSFVPPINDHAIRVTKKSFGTYVTPENSPVDPERFTGFHTGADFEIVRGEEVADVPIYTICGGELIYKRSVSGYGGVAIQSCQLGNQGITVLYGHLRLASITHSIGTYLAPGAKLGVLGTGFSPETDGERKHLHLSVHKGTGIELRGYVSNQNQLSNWIDPMTLYDN